MGSAIYTAAEMLVIFLYFLIFIRILMSWLPFINRSNPIVNIIYSLTEPILSPIREAIKRSPIGGAGMMLDFSPVIAWLLLRVILMVLHQVLM